MGDLNIFLKSKTYLNVVMETLLLESKKFDDLLKYYKRKKNFRF